MKIKVGNFDWSGTVSDDRKPVYEANMRVLENHGIERISFEEWLPNTLLTAAEFFRENGIEGNDDFLLGLYKTELDNTIRDGIIPTIYPDSYNTLEYLAEKGIILVVVSSHPQQNLLEEVNAYGLEEIFSLINGSSIDKVKSLKEVLKKLEIRSNESIYVDDTIFGVRAAKQAGCYSAAVLGGYHTEERLSNENPDIILEKLSDLKSII